MNRVIRLEQLNQFDFVGKRTLKPHLVLTQKEWSSVASVARRFGCGDVLEGATCLDSRYVAGLRRAFDKALAFVEPRTPKKKKAATDNPAGFSGTMKPSPRAATATNAPSKEELALVGKVSDFIEKYGRQGVMVNLTFPD